MRIAGIRERLVDLERANLVLRAELARLRARLGLERLAWRAAAAETDIRLRALEALAFTGSQQDLVAPEPVAIEAIPCATERS